MYLHIEHSHLSNYTGTKLYMTFVVHTQYSFKFHPYIIPVLSQSNTFPENVWVAYIQHPTSSPACLLYRCKCVLGVMKNLVIFFQQNSFHILELVVVRWVSQMLNHSSSVSCILLYFIHLSLMYSVEVPQFFFFSSLTSSNPWYNAEITLPVLFYMHYTLSQSLCSTPGFISFSKNSLTGNYLNWLLTSKSYSLFKFRKFLILPPSIIVHSTVIP